MLLRPFGGIFAPGIDLDVSDVARGGSGFPQVVGVLGFLGAQVLLLVSWTLGYHRNDQIDGRHFVVAVGAHERDRDGSAALVDDEVDLRSEFPLSVGFLPVCSPPKGAAQFLESIACHLHPTPPHSLA